MTMYLNLASMGLEWAKAATSAQPVAKAALSLAHTAVAAAILTHTVKYTVDSARDSQQSVQAIGRQAQPHVRAALDRTRAVMHRQDASVTNLGDAAASG